MSAQPWPEEDERDRLERIAAADSRARFLNLLGPTRQYLDAEGSQDVNVGTGDEGRIFVVTDAGKFEAPERMRRADRRALITAIATRCETSIGPAQSRLEADMPHDFDVRVHAACPPVGDWWLKMRVHARRVHTLDDYVLAGIATAEQVAEIKAAIRRGDNILVAGKPGAGKTTLVNAILEYSAQVWPNASLTVIQDRKELKPSHVDVTPILARVKQARWHNGVLAQYEYTFEEALEDALRTGFDQIAWGEIRSPQSAAGLFLALNTGAAGLVTTLHANSARKAVYRFEDLLHLAGIKPRRSMICEAIQFAIFIGLDDDRNRRIQETARLTGIDASDEFTFQDDARKDRTA
jgi:Flp pilus assembly CpaF family ATPase